jgi:hypothetical protein
VKIEESRVNLFNIQAIKNSLPKQSAQKKKEIEGPKMLPEELMIVKEMVKINTNQSLSVLTAKNNL